LCFLTVFKAFGQTDSLQIFTPKKQKPIFVINADFRQSFVKDEPTTIYGGYIGLKYKQKHLYSLGYYTLSESSRQMIKSQNQKRTIPINDDVSLWFLSLGYTRTIYNGKIFKFEIPLEVGLGEASNNVYRDDGKVINLTTGAAMPLQIGGSATIKVTRWFGIHLQAGHREIIGKSIFKDQYTGVYYAYGINFNIWNIYSDLRR
jgi:hypothetical protein